MTSLRCPHCRGVLMELDAPATPAVEDGMLVTMDRVAEMLGVSRSYIEKRVAAGELVPVKLGRSSRFAVEDVRAYVARVRHGHSEEAPASSPVQLDSRRGRQLKRAPEGGR